MIQAQVLDLVQAQVPEVARELAAEKEWGESSLDVVVRIHARDFCGPVEEVRGAKALWMPA
jgi:hypothetical protein